MEYILYKGDCSRVTICECYSWKMAIKSASMYHSIKYKTGKEYGLRHGEYGSLINIRWDFPPNILPGVKLVIYINWVRTSEETHYVSATKTNRLMLFGETVAVYCENHTEYTDTLCGQNAEFWCVKTSGTYSNH
jgi:hypothetical protein